MCNQNSKVHCSFSIHDFVVFLHNWKVSFFCFAKMIFLVISSTILHYKNRKKPLWCSQKVNVRCYYPPPCWSLLFSNLDWFPSWLNPNYFSSKWFWFWFWISKLHIRGIDLIILLLKLLMATSLIVLDSSHTYFMKYFILKNHLRIMYKYAKNESFSLCNSSKGLEEP